MGTGVGAAMLFALVLISLGQQCPILLEEIRVFKSRRLEYCSMEWNRTRVLFCWFGDVSNDE